MPFHLNVRVEHDKTQVEGDAGQQAGGVTQFNEDYVSEAAFDKIKNCAEQSPHFAAACDTCPMPNPSFATQNDEVNFFRQLKSLGKELKTINETEADARHPEAPTSSQGEKTRNPEGNGNNEYISRFIEFWTSLATNFCAIALPRY